MELETLIQSIHSLTNPQLVELTKKLEAEWGVSAAPQTVQTTAPVPEIAKVVQTEFTVMLTSVPAAAKIAVIKMLREINGISLMEAKTMVEAAPKAIKENVSQEEADNVKTRLTEAGAVIELK